ncbi:hypothetical protein DFJ74DRAFT_653092 [Hyaloraphidium curvatum]|nr:hypothetical protein DFJ74DRAFT_653092 [Hyaloraphidium curvatum]
MQPAMQPHAPLPLPQQYFAVVPAQGGPPGGTQFVPYVQLQRAAPASSPSDDANADAGFDGPASYPPLPGRPVYVARPPVRYPAMAPAMPMLPPGYAGMPPPAVYPAPVPGGYLYAAPPQLRPAKMDGYRPPSYNMALPYLPAPPPPGPTDADDAPITNIYIRGLSATVTDEQLHDMCRGFGRIVSSKAIIDIRTNECKGYGFVMYETQDEARLAMGELARRGLQVSFAKESFSARLKNLQDSGSTNIYLSNIPIGLTEEVRRRSGGGGPFALLLTRG